MLKRNTLSFSELTYLLTNYYGRANKRYCYDSFVYSFQRSSGCLMVDGLYGPETERMLTIYLNYLYNDKFAK